MASACEELAHTARDDLITRGTTVLIDDDENNISQALEHGVRAVSSVERRRGRTHQEYLHRPVRALAL